MECKKFKVVSEDDLLSVISTGLNWVRVSFPTIQNPIYVAFKSKPTFEELSDFLHTQLLIEEREFTLTWSCKE